MKTIVKILLTVFLSISFSSSFEVKANCSNVNHQNQAVTDYKVRVCIDGTWYIFVYDNDGYLINIYEDDE